MYLACGSQILHWKALKLLQEYSWFGFRDSSAGQLLNVTSSVDRGGNILGVLEQSQIFGCQYPRDRIGALTSICPCNFQVDYGRSTAENYYFFAKQMVEQGSLEPLLLSSIYRMVAHDTGDEVEKGIFPFWVPDWRLSHDNAFKFGPRVNQETPCQVVGNVLHCLGSYLVASHHWNPNNIREEWQHWKAVTNGGYLEI
jgi:hypothetical protein